MNIGGTLFIMVAEALMTSSVLLYAKFVTSNEQRYRKFRSKAIVQGRLGKYVETGETGNE